MNKNIKIILMTVVFIFISYDTLAQTGILKAYKNSTIANEPNLKLNSRILISNLVTPKNGDFIGYNYEDNFSGKQMRIHRLYGKENDTLQIINGILFLNNIDVDKGIDHIHFYQTYIAEYLKIKQAEKIPDEYFAFPIDNNKVNVLLQDSLANKYGLTSKRLIDKKEDIDKSIQKIFNKNWNKDNFGPLIIPSGKIFVIGDNRDNSEDSRYIGLIDTSQIVGVLVFN
jgi:signal peptidase I